MKDIKLFSGICLLFLNCERQPKKVVKDKIASNFISKIVFQDTLFDSGDNKVSKKNELKVFSFTNTGNNPINIQYVKPDCQCTKVLWSEKLILPNENGEISIYYDIGIVGKFSEKINVFYSGSEKPVQLYITGNVLQNNY